MPSSSRKRNKGQARKARAKAAAATSAVSNLPVLWKMDKDGVEEGGCKHGDVKVPNFPAACSGFLTEYYQSFFTLLDLSNMGVVGSADSALSLAHSKFPDAINNKNFRQLIRTNFIGNGADFLLRDKHQSKMSWAFAAVLLVIDSYDPTKHITPGIFEERPQIGLGIDDRDAAIYLTNMDIITGCNRSLIKYFVNQIPCNCLDELYALVRSTTPKMGKCFGCHQMKERSNLYVCTGCERVEFCSKACQIASVPIHKDLCKIWQRGEFVIDYISRERD